MKITRRVSPLAFILILAIVIAVVIALPLIGIWSLNTLFPQLAIPYDIYTWLAMFVMLGVLSPRVKVDKQS